MKKATGQTAQLIITLKKALKANGVSYAQVAQALSLSEASVKRLFSEQSFTLQRLETICQIINMDISDLVQMMADNNKGLSQLNLQQEQQIASNIELLLITVCVLNRWTMKQIMDQFDLTEHQCIRHLVQLDRLKIIDLMPFNRIKLRVSSNFKWHDNGPIQRFYQEKLQAEFFRSRFDKKNERLIVINGMLSDTSNTKFQQKMEDLVHEFDTLNNDDLRLDFKQRHGTTVVLAMRQWQHGIFDKLRQKPTL